jgi:cyclopropane fatty-acyl-phospholipid synthase-like methyltransferase
MAESARSRLKRGVRRAAKVLPPPRDQAVLRLLRATYDLMTGQKAPPARRGANNPPQTPGRKPDARRKGFGTVPGPRLPSVARVAADAPWSDPPHSERTGLSRSIYDPGSSSRPVFDIALLEELNEEYRNRPIVPAPRAWTSEALGAAAKNRVLWAHHTVDLKDKTVLEVGCGNGYEVWSMAHNLGADAHGVDVIQPSCWEDLEGERVQLRCVDLTVDNPFTENTFDRIVSYTVWEHVRHPHKLLEETYRILKPGGLQWLRANLWAGPRASHRYRDIYFPWPHHLFSDDVIAEWNVQHGREPRGSAWVNKLTWNHYERYIHDIGYRLRQLSFTEAEWDEDFYQRFEDVLGRIPRWDLKRDFFTAVLEKPAD